MNSTTTETPKEALARIRSGASKNDVVAIMAFAATGIDPDAISPRQNVLTFRAWRATGRQVAKGAISVRVTVWITRKGKEVPKPDEVDKGTVWGKGSTWPKTTALFHISQTIPQERREGRLFSAYWLFPPYSYRVSPLDSPAPTFLGVSERIL